MRIRTVGVWVAAMALVLVSVPASAQVESCDSSRNDTSPPLADLAAQATPSRGPSGFVREMNPIRVVDSSKRSARGSSQPDGALQWAEMFDYTPSPLENFEGQSADDNAAVHGQRFVPPDTDGTVGLDHYLQWINIILEIYDKDGNSVLGPIEGNTVFDGFGGACETTNNGDPISLYDQKNDRYVITQFAINSGIQCVAVSATDDPTGTWHRYEFNVGGPDGANDYPKHGIWLTGSSDVSPDGSPLNDVFTATYRMFGGPGGGFSLDPSVMEYEKMLVGDPAGCFIARGNSVFPGDDLEGLLPVDVDGNEQWATDNCPLFVKAHDEGFDGTTPPGTDDGIRFFDFCVNPERLAGGSVGSSAVLPSFQELPFVVSSDFNRSLGRIPQPSPGEALDDHSFFTMARAPLRFHPTGVAGPGGTTEAQLVLTTTVDACPTTGPDCANADVGGIRWFDLRNTGGGWTLDDDGTFAPGAQNDNYLERWMPSIATDKDGNIAVGYSASNSMKEPSVRYTGHKVETADGILLKEVNAHAGTGVQTASANRWGDYSNMSIDPVDDCTFWFTTEYYETTGGFDFTTRIVSFAYPSCASPTDTGTFDISIDSGTCGSGSVDVSYSGGSHFGEILLLASRNDNGMTLPTRWCKGTQLDIGRAIQRGGGVSFDTSDGSGGGSINFDPDSEHCFVQAIDLDTCAVSSLQNIAPPD